MNSHRTFLTVLFPKVRAKLLQAIFGTPGQQRYVRQLALISGLNVHTVHDELRKLGAIGLVVSWSNGYHRFYHANREHASIRSYAGLFRRAKIFHRQEPPR